MGTVKIRLWALGCLLAGELFAGDLAEGLQFPDLRTGTPADIGPVTAETVEGFELLYATPGTGDIAEIAGHLLLRIRIRREPADPDRDLVVSFLAATPEVLTSFPDADQAPDCRKGNWLNLVRAPGVAVGEDPLVSMWQSVRGLTGGFPVTMDLQTFAYTLKTYTVEQDRTLRRYELILTEEQKAGLIDRLIRYPQEELPRYFFFHQNCGSVLVRILGEGIGEKRIANFAPAVSPPHSLVGLLLREGRVRPVSPDVHSFRDRGRLFRPALTVFLEQQRLEDPGAGWPSANAFMNPHAKVRLAAVEQLRSIGTSRPELDPVLYPFASLLQEAETVFDPKDRFCRDATGPVTAEIRRWQQEMLLRTGEAIAVPVPEPPEGPPRTGTDHTGLYPLEVKAGWKDEVDSTRQWDVFFATRALRQEMGSRSRVAMQRAGAVDLFAIESKADSGGIHDVAWTGLNLSKFREGLGRVEAGPWRGRAWGMGLRVLEGEWERDTGTWQGTLAGASVLLNLASTEGFDSHLYVQAGVDGGHRNSDWGVRMPLALHGLISVGTTQYRLHASWTESWISSEAETWETRLRINRRIGSWRGADWNGLLEWESEEERGNVRQAVRFGIEILRF